MRRFVVNYVERHQNTWNRLLHLVGVPVTFLVPIVFAVRGQPWTWAVAAFVGGYALQFLGHAIEGNDAGEVVLVKKWLGLSYQEFMPGSPADLRVRGEAEVVTLPLVTATNADEEREGRKAA